MPRVGLVFDASLPVLNQVLSVANHSKSLYSIVTSKHAVFGLVEQIDVVLHAWGTLVKGKVVLVLNLVDPLLGPLLLHVLLPDTKHVYRSALRVRPFESQFVVPISLAIVKGYQAPLFE